jgi:hypothetical protein
VRQRSALERVFCPQEIEPRWLTITSGSKLRVDMHRRVGLIEQHIELRAEDAELQGAYGEDLREVLVEHDLMFLNEPKELSLKRVQVG